MLCDSNIVIYAAESNDNRCIRFVEADTAAIASVTRIEVLGFQGFRALPVERRDRLTRIVSSLIQITLDEQIIQRAILLRQQQRLRLGDAVKAATALVKDFELVTRDVSDFDRVDGLRLINPFADTT